MTCFKKKLQTRGWLSHVYQIFPSHGKIWILDPDDRHVCHSETDHADHSTTSNLCSIEISSGSISSQLMKTRMSCLSVDDTSSHANHVRLVLFLVLLLGSP
ncbi:hypothetical protein O6H91_01G122800 [Diphasiastrum complanatum]|uniref:Uncharacterized protein n=1 Tax=Diphasiastrum complanatum TaxID=34168 RepID=A0ACC2EVP6_DIPCM|nr:hypothetical protein O6H91_01G122800 [Diphasiastrum complanatum]